MRLACNISLLLCVIAGSCGAAAAQPSAAPERPPNARTQMEATVLGGDLIYLNEDELKMHPVEVFDVGRPWENLKSRLPKIP